MRIFLVFFIVAVIAVIALMGIRGGTFTQTPLEIFPDMKRQYKLKAQGENNFFADHRNEQPNPAGTVATTPDNLSPQIKTPSYYSDPLVMTGKNPDGSFHRGFPAMITPITFETLQAGRKNFEIYCAACHGFLGNGEGVTRNFGMNTAANLQDARIREMPEGEIFNTASNGKGLMLGYKNRLNPIERWQVIAYLRSLQLSQNMTLEKLPAK